MEFELQRDVVNLGGPGAFLLTAAQEDLVMVARLGAQKDHGARAGRPLVGRGEAEHPDVEVLHPLEIRHHQSDMAEPEARRVAGARHGDPPAMKGRACHAGPTTTSARRPN